MEYTQSQQNMRTERTKIEQVLKMEFVKRNWLLRNHKNKRLITGVEIKKLVLTQISIITRLIVTKKKKKK